MDNSAGKYEQRLYELYEWSKSEGGLWWWANDRDNPFLVPLLAIPKPSKKRTKMAVYLYSIDELERKVKTPSLISKDNRTALLHLAGWPIYQDGTLLSWTLPERLQCDMLVDRVMKLISQRKKSRVTQKKAWRAKKRKAVNAKKANNSSK